MARVRPYSISNTMTTAYGNRPRMGLHGTVHALQRTMLHITVAKTEGGSIVRLSGALAGEFVAVADRACAAVDEALVIDVSQLQSADEEGLAWLARTVDRGVPLEGLSGYLTLRLSQQKEQKGR